MLAESYILLSAQNATLAYQDIEVGNLSVRHHSRPPRQPQPQIKGIEWQARECTAYNSVPEQTDDSPCIASDGSDICRRRQKGECIIATNEFENGTLVLIEGIGQCTVADKTNRRYQHRIDVFMGDDVTGAKNFGSKILNIYKLN
jgi:3D (Asp-Asp-Asp) domain-containing protein